MIAVFILLPFRAESRTNSWLRHATEARPPLLSLCEGNLSVICGLPAQRIINVELWCVHITSVWFTWPLCYRRIYSYINTLRPRRNEQHFADDIFKRIFFNENVWISIKISLKFVPKGPINNIPALVQIMAWRRSGDKPLSEPMMVSLPTHICVTRPQWVNDITSFPSTPTITLPRVFKYLMNYLQFENPMIILRWCLPQSITAVLLSNSLSSVTYNPIHMFAGFDLI